MQRHEKSHQAGLALGYPQILYHAYGDTPELESRVQVADLGQDILFEARLKRWPVVLRFAYPKAILHLEELVRGADPTRRHPDAAEAIATVLTCFSSQPLEVKAHLQGRFRQMLPLVREQAERWLERTVQASERRILAAAD